MLARCSSVEELPCDKSLAATAKDLSHSEVHARSAQAAGPRLGRAATVSGSMHERAPLKASENSPISEME